MNIYYYSTRVEGVEVREYHIRLTDDDSKGKRDWYYKMKDNYRKEAWKRIEEIYNKKSTTKSQEIEFILLFVICFHKYYENFDIAKMNYKLWKNKDNQTDLGLNMKTKEKIDIPKRGTGVIK